MCICLQGKRRKDVCGVAHKEHHHLRQREQSRNVNVQAAQKPWGGGGGSWVGGAADRWVKDASTWGSSLSSATAASRKSPLPSPNGIADPYTSPCFSFQNLQSTRHGFEREACWSFPCVINGCCVLLPLLPRSSTAAAPSSSSASSSSSSAAAAAAAKLSSRIPVCS